MIIIYFRNDRTMSSGYLVENNCESAAQLFLETSDHLKECYAFQKKGRKVATKVMGLSLDDIINQYTYAVSICKYTNQLNMQASVINIAYRRWVTSNSYKTCDKWEYFLSSSG